MKKITRNNSGFTESEEITIVIPDYRTLFYGDPESHKIYESENAIILNELEKELKDVIDFELIEKHPAEDCGMGAPFPVISLWITAAIALPSAIVSTIKLIEIIQKFVKNMRIENEKEKPVYGLPIFHPIILENLCHEILIKTYGDKGFSHVLTIDTSLKDKYYYYGVVYLIIFKSNHHDLNQMTFPHYEFRVKCTGELIDFREVIPKEDELKTSLPYAESDSIYNQLVNDNNR